MTRIDSNLPPEPDRRALLRAALAVPILALPGCSAVEVGANGPTALDITPACDDGDDDLTEPQTQGPYFTRNSPERASLLEPGLNGTRLTVIGRVLTASCAPVGGALLDFWQADDSGSYDLNGYRLRGHQFTDAQGHFSLETIVPGLYPGRTRHIHVKVQAANGPILTTQLYFPGESRNASDGIYDDSLLLQITRSGAAQQGLFNVVIRT